MRLGVGSYTFVWAVGVPGFEQPQQPLTAAKLLELAAELGIGVVQIADNLPLDRLSGAERRARWAPLPPPTSARTGASVSLESRPDHTRSQSTCSIALSSTEPAATASSGATSS